MRDCRVHAAEDGQVVAPVGRGCRPGASGYRPDASIWAGLVIWMTPPQVQASLQFASRARTTPILIAGDPGAQGAGVAGTQGIGVRTPKAAVVAEATAGFAGEVHMPKGGTLAIGLLSAMVAAGVPVRMPLTGGMASTEGVVPRLHCKVAPAHTSIATRPVYLRDRIPGGRRCVVGDARRRGRMGGRSLGRKAGSAATAARSRYFSLTAGCIRVTLRFLSRPATELHNSMLPGLAFGPHQILAFGPSPAS